MFIVGCEAIYTVEIDGNIFKESLEVNNRNKDSWHVGEFSYEEEIRMNAELFIPIDNRYDVEEDEVEGVDYHNVELIDNADNLGLRLSHPFNNVNEYYHSTLIRNHWVSLRFTDKDGKFKVVSGNDNRAFEMYSHLTNVTVRLISKHKIIEHNADMEENGMLIWHFTRQNYQNKEINVELDIPFEESKTDAESLNEEPTLEKEDWWELSGSVLMTVYLVIIAIVIIVGLPFIYFKVKNSNR